MLAPTEKAPAEEGCRKYMSTTFYKTKAIEPTAASGVLRILQEG